MATPATAAAIGIKIVAQNQAGATIAGVSKSIVGLKRAASSQPVSDLAKKLGYLSQSSKGLGSELDELAWHTLGRLGSAAPRTAASLARLGAGMALAVPAAATAGIIGFTEHLATMGADASRAADRLGLSVGTLSRFQIASRLAGASAEDATTGLNGLQATLNAAAHGQDPQSFAMFKALGIDMAQGARDVTAVLPRIAQVTQQLARTNPAAAQRFLDLAGVGRQLYFVFKDGTAGLTRYLGEAQQLGPVTEENARRALELQRAQVGLSVAFENFGQTVGGTFAPALTSLLHTFQTYLTEHRPDVERFFGEIEHGLEWITKPETEAKLEHYLDAFVDGLKDVYHWAQQIEESPLVRRLLGLSVPTQVSTSPIGSGIPVDSSDPTDDALRRLDEENVQRFHARTPSVLAAPADSNRPVVAPGNLAADRSLSPEARALLDTISGPESRGQYNIINGGRHFDDMSRHPNWINPSTDSSAAGRYQMLGSTWRNAQQAAHGQAPDYTPVSQDRGAWALAQQVYRQKTGGDLASALRDPSKMESIQRALGGTDLWSSLNMRGYAENLTRERAAAPASTAPAGASPPYAPNAPAAAIPAPPMPGGLLRVQIEHPPGARVTVQPEGIDPRTIDITQPVVRRSMPTPSGPAMPG